MRSNAERRTERLQRKSRLNNAEAVHKEKRAALFQLEIDSAASGAGMTTKEYIMNLPKADYRALKARKAQVLRGC